MLLYWCKGYKKFIKDKKFIQGRHFCLFFLGGGPLEVTSWNIRSFLEFPLQRFYSLKYKKRKYRRFFRGFHFLEYNKFSRAGVLILLRKNIRKLFSWGNIRKAPFSKIYENIRIFLNIRTRKFYFQKYEELFWGNFFVIFWVGKCAMLSSSIIYY